MAYCSYCAAVLDPNLAACPRCGRPTPAASVPTPVVPAISAPAPRSVRISVILILVSVGISVLTLASNIVIHRITNGAYLIPAIFLMVLWIVLAFLLWQRQGWARIAILLFIAWNIVNLVTTMLRYHGMQQSLVIAVVFDAMRLFAAYLTFTPESNAWFKK